MVSIIPGQKTGDADDVIEGKAGDIAQSPIEVLEVTCHWIENEKKLYDLRVQYTHRLGYPRTAYDVADLAWVGAKGSMNEKP